MCFYIHPKHPKVKIAKRDITCYKVVFPPSFCIYRSSVTGFRYILGKQYTVGPQEKEFVRERDYWSNEIEPFKIGGGAFHSFSNKKKIKCFPRVWSRIKCIIPKGSRYYYNPDYKEYCSNAIMLVEEL